MSAHIIINMSGSQVDEGLAEVLYEPVLLDLSKLEGTNCYCDPQAREQIRKVLEPYAAEAVHWIDTGDYHYLSSFWAEKIQQEFALVVFDHHPDMQQPAFGQMLSCGGWVRSAFAECGSMRQVLLMGIKPELELEILDLVFDGVLACTEEDFRLKANSAASLPHEVLEMISLLEPGIPVYVSIDKDVLGSGEARTDWDQGTMSLSQLEMALDEIASGHSIIGFDICGGLTRAKGGSDEDFAINLATDTKLAEICGRY